uniref:RadC family protein n=1 Tax=Candidatus Ventrenecus sp. TaxID=3085654 RepID=UPI003FF07249
MSFKIKELPEEEKPREKAILRGVENLTIPELIAIIIKTGSKEESAKDLGVRLYNELGCVEGLRNLRLSNLTRLKGIGKTKAISLMAAIELGKKINVNNITGLKKIHETKDVYFYYGSYFLFEEQEKLLALFLNSKNEVIKEKIIFMGTANQSIVHPRDIFKEAILNNAIKIIIVHNHPSGNVTPSLEDKKFTQKLKEAGELLSIPILDHIIIGNNTYFSFLEQNLL